jgi:hypothetical protein
MTSLGRPEDRCDDNIDDGLKLIGYEVAEWIKVVPIGIICGLL